MKRNKRKNYGDDTKHSRPTGWIELKCIGGCGRTKRVRGRTGDEHSWMCDKCRKEK